jgi:hypothetical protein
MPGQAFAIIISVLVFACVGLAAFGIAKLVSERGAGLRRLERFSKPEAKSKPEAAGPRGADDGGKRKHSIDELIRSILTAFGKAFEGKQYTSKIEKELARADIPLRGSEFVGTEPHPCACRSGLGMVSD